VLALNDARRFGSVDLVDTQELESWPPFVAMGPEPLGEQFTAQHLAEAFRHRIAPVKVLLLDQRVVAGLGNIYVCEALHRAGIRPDKEAGKISRQALARLVPAIKDVLTESIEAGGSTIRDYASPTASSAISPLPARLWARRRSLPLRRHGGTLHPGRAQHLLVPQMPEVRGFLVRTDV